MEQHEKLVQVYETLEVTANKTVDIMNCNYAYYNDKGLYFSLFNNAQDAWNCANGISFDVENRILDSVDESELDRYLNSNEFMNDYIIYVAESNKSGMLLEYSLYSEEFMCWYSKSKDVVVKYFNWVQCIYRVKQHEVITFPALYASLNDSKVVKFDNFECGTVVFVTDAEHNNTGDAEGTVCNDWICCTDATYWKPYVPNNEFIKKFKNTDFGNVRYDRNGEYYYLGNIYRTFYDLKYKDTVFIHIADIKYLEAFSSGKRVMVSSSKDSPETVVTDFLKEYVYGNHYRIERIKTETSKMLDNAILKNLYEELKTDKWKNEQGSWSQAIEEIQKYLVSLDKETVIQHQYPRVFRSKQTGWLVEFVGLKEGTRIDIITDNPYHSKDFIPHTDTSVWDSVPSYYNLRKKIYKVFTESDEKLAEELLSKHTKQQLRDACDLHIKEFDGFTAYEKFRNTHPMFLDA